MGKTDFLIPLNGLATGETVFRWTVGKGFFDGFGNSEILGAALEVEAHVWKHGQEISIDCIIDGDITVACDRCLADLSLPVHSEAGFSIGYGGSDDTDMSEDGREMICVEKTDPELDLSQAIYDYACLALPLQRVHAEGECDPEVLYRMGLDTGSVSEDNNEGESPFAALKDIFRS